MKKEVCEGKVKNCTKTKADLTKAPKIVITLGSKKITFDSDDYIYFKDDDLKCRFGDICDQRSEGVCSDKTEVVLGKLFFEKFTPMFTVQNNSENATITLLTSFKAPKERVLVWLIIGIIAAIVAVLALVFIIVKRRKENAEDPDDTYEKVSSGISEDNEEHHHEEEKHHHEEENQHSDNEQTV